MAVEERGEGRPTASDDFHGKPHQSATKPIATAVPRTWSPPRPRIGPSFATRAGRNSRPMTKSIMTTPNSAKCMTFASAGDKPQCVWPDDSAGEQVADHRPEPEPFRRGTATIAASRMMNACRVRRSWLSALNSHRCSPNYNSQNARLDSKLENPCPTRSLR